MPQDSKEGFESCCSNPWEPAGLQGFEPRISSSLTTEPLHLLSVCMISDYSILDCIYSEIHRTYWVLDCMCWHGHPVYDSETEFRFFWLQSKLAENPELATGFKKHPVSEIQRFGRSCL